MTKGTIHVKKLDKYHPGYKDRNLTWAKLYFKMVQGDPEFEMIESEIDKWRFITLICLELEAKKPLPLDKEYFKRKGWDIKKRSMSLTLKMLQNFIVVVTEDSNLRNVDKDKDKEEEKEKDKEEEKKRNLSSINLSEFKEKFPHIDVDYEFEKFSDYVANHPRKYKDFPAAFRNWLRSDWVRKKEVKKKSYLLCPDCGWKFESEATRMVCRKCKGTMQRYVASSTEQP
jgi:hypothetical protein